MTMSICAGPAWLAPKIRTSHRIIHGYYRRNIRAGYTWIMPFPSCRLTGQFLWTLTQSTHVFTQLVAPRLNYNASVGGGFCQLRLSLYTCYGNSTIFLREKFQAWCREQGITPLTGAPYTLLQTVLPCG